MALSAETLRQITYSLNRGHRVLEYAELLREEKSQSAIEALVEALYHPSTAQSGTTLISVLEETDHPIIRDVLQHGLESEYASLRLEAIQSLKRRKSDRYLDYIQRLVRDSSWVVRRAALDALSEFPIPICWRIFVASDDPHWRVRHALIQVLLEWGKDSIHRDEINRSLGSSDSSRIQGLLNYLHYRWEGRGTLPKSIDPDDPTNHCPFWDWDPAVLARKMESMNLDSQLPAMPFLLGHEDERVRQIALDRLRSLGESHHFAECIQILDEPRQEACQTVQKLLTELSIDQRVDIARTIFRLPNPSPQQLAYAINQIEWDESAPQKESSEFPGSTSNSLSQSSRVQQWRKHESSIVRIAFLRLLSRWNREQSEEETVGFLDDPDFDVQLEALKRLHEFNRKVDAKTLQWIMSSPDHRIRSEGVFFISSPTELSEYVQDPHSLVRASIARRIVEENADQGTLVEKFQTDSHPHVRAAILNENRARDLLLDPEKETSWGVLQTASKLVKQPIWKIAPKTSSIIPLDRERIVESLVVAPRKPKETRFLANRFSVAPMSISGHYGLPVEGFVLAMEHGVNFYFWEPNYSTLTEFSSRLNPKDRRELYFLVGTFEADSKRIRKDVDRTLRMLHLEQISVFLLFWVQSWDRITPEIRETLSKLQEEGKIGTYGLSSHSRSLLLQAMKQEWNPIMTRHSVAFRGAEEAVFSEARRYGKSLITFNNTCYGRLLKPLDGLPGLSAADCYRYTLSFPEVTMCWSAPSTVEQLCQNLEVLDSPHLSLEQKERMVRFGEKLYEEESTFRKCVRLL
jgi:HEAT repeat protein